MSLVEFAVMIRSSNLRTTQFNVIIKYLHTPEFLKMVEDQFLANESKNLPNLVIIWTCFHRLKMNSDTTQAMLNLILNKSLTQQGAMKILSCKFYMKSTGYIYLIENERIINYLKFHI